jgi:hypothetical protein
MTNCIPVYYTDKDKNLLLDDVTIMGNLDVDSITLTDLTTVEGGLPTTGGIISGTFDPNAHNTTNVASINASHGYYIRVGNIVYLSVRGTIAATAGASTLTEFDLDVPVALPPINNLIGFGTGFRNNTVSSVRDLLMARLSTTVITCEFLASDTDAGTFIFTFTYPVS